MSTIHPSIEAQRNFLLGLADMYNLKITSPKSILDAEFLDLNFFTEADYRHNLQVNQEAVSWSNAEAADAEARTGQPVNPRFIYADPIWHYENIDADGRANPRFANGFKLDSNENNWHTLIQNNLIAAMNTKKPQIISENPNPIMLTLTDTQIEQIYRQRHLQLHIETAKTQLLNFVSARFNLDPNQNFDLLDAAVLKEYGISLTALINPGLNRLAEDFITFQSTLPI